MVPACFQYDAFAMRQGARGPGREQPQGQGTTTYYNQARTKYGKCQYFTESVPGDSVPGGGTLETTTQSISKASVGKYQAFEVGQISDLPTIRALPSS